MSYGETCRAAVLLKDGRTRAQLCAAGVASQAHGADIVTFDDGSFIELCKWGQHQAFLKNGWNVTPRDKGESK